MSLVQAANISIAFGDRVILKEVSFNIDKQSRIALTGGNGSGKSTFLKILAGLIQPDSGQVLTAKGTRISYLPQNGALISSNTLLEEAEQAYNWIIPLQEEKTEIERKLGKAGEPGKNTESLIDRRHELEEKILNSGYYDRKRDIEKVLTGLGFNHNDLEADPATFSGGRRMRISLARVLLEQPDVLLLDEPTNFLDLEAREWLETFISHYPGGVVLVSHDRYFLDTTMSCIAELFLGSISLYRGNYTAYEKRRTAELEELTTAYYRQIKEIRKIENFIERFRYNASKAQLVQSRIGYLEKLERLEIPETLKKIHFSFPRAPDSGKNVLSIRCLEKRYGDNTVFKNLTLDISRGETLALVGMNGAGKSTLIRIIAQVDTEFKGEIEYGTGVKIGYFSQESADMLSGTNTVIDEIEGVSRYHTDQEIRNLLGAFLFRDEDIYKSINVLSGGEKSRLALMKLLLSPVNLLLLDEPTSHLDMTSKDILLDALTAFEGTIIFVAHDRGFVEALADRVLDLEGEEPTYYYGGYDYYLYRKQQNSQSGGNDLPRTEKSSSEGKIKRQREKDIKKTVRKLKSKEEKILERIAILEEEYKTYEKKLALPENYTDGERVKELKDTLAENRKHRDILHTEWEHVDSELARIISKENPIS